MVMASSFLFPWFDNICLFYLMADDPDLISVHLIVGSAERRFGSPIAD